MRFLLALYLLPFFLVRKRYEDLIRPSPLSFSLFLIYSLFCVVELAPSLYPFDAITISVAFRQPDPAPFFLF